MSSGVSKKAYIQRVDCPWKLLWSAKIVDQFLILEVQKLQNNCDKAKTSNFESQLYGKSDDFYLGMS